MAEYLTILSTLLAISHVVSATSYDQRQDGKFNVHAKLENLLIVITSSSFDNDNNNNNNPSAINDLATQILELRSLPSCKNVNEKNSSISKYGNIETWIKRCKENDTIEVIPIQEENTKKFEFDVLQGVDKKTMVQDLKKDEKVNTGQEKNADEAVSDVKKISEQRRARNLWNRFSDLANSKNNVSLKKVVSNKGDKLFNEFTNFGDKNEVGLDINKPQELTLLGGAVENCGPGRYRNSFGVCQFDNTRNY